LETMRISDTDLDRAVQFMKQEGCRFGEALVRSGAITATERYAALRLQLREKTNQFAFSNEKANRLYIDLGSGRMLRLDGKEITELDNGSDGVLFTPAPFSEPWTYRPDAPKGILSRTLMGSLNFSTASDSPHTPAQQQVLMIMWLLAIPFESVQPTKPLALLLGPAGSGKSNLWRRVGRMLYGPRFELDTVKRDGENDFLVAVTNSPFVALDNVDHWVPWLDDALATSATGMQVTKKELYTTNRSVSYRARAFLALTARTPRFRREDVAERLIIFTLDKIEERKAENHLLREVQENRDHLMSDYSHMLNAVVGVTDYEIADPGMRLADFGNVASRIAASLYMSDEAVEILEGLKQAQHIYATEENPLYLLLDSWTTQGAKDAAGKMLGATNSGRGILAKQLYLELKQLAEDQGLKWRINNPIGLGKQIMAIEEALSIYFTIEKKETRQGNMYTFTRRDPKEIEDTMAEADRG
ncbi:MAG: hypothetical protein IH955_11435, partial [Chloroflexi bacterium]|nr:hypothetical protein [Chloroflexota bacterium]